jgi:hypothetical protein
LLVVLGFEEFVPSKVSGKFLKYRSAAGIILATACVALWFPSQIVQPLSFAAWSLCVFLLVLGGAAALNLRYI